MKNLLGGLFIFLSSSLLQHALQSPSFLSPYLALLSLLLELLSLYFLPLSIFFLLGSSHILAFSLYQKKNKFKDINNKEAVGNSLITIGCLISIFLCSEQQTFNDPDELNQTINPLYFTWMGISFLLNAGMRSCGFYAGKVLIETSIPSQLISFSFLAAKYLWLCFDLFIQDEHVNYRIIIGSVIVLIVSMLIALSFIKYFLWIYSEILVCTGYYLWLLCYGFPLGISLLHCGYELTQKDCLALLLATIFITLGCYLHTYSVPEKENLQTQDIKDDDEYEEIDTLI
ncbi:hypothetical protein SteCoe_17617 [Stentor coeruleus]|uniref:Uncharacterized protein n=1 Tax=Stentor coeruleus TaxID=5963 RepID=A0A1R2BYR3_9CILI|nr:hypothetical protein SteCoe_17617 [Stentor coeruleus]